MPFMWQLSVFSKPGCPRYDWATCCRAARRATCPCWSLHPPPGASLGLLRQFSVPPPCLRTWAILRCLRAFHVKSTSVLAHCLCWRKTGDCTRGRGLGLSMQRHCGLPSQQGVYSSPQIPSSSAGPSSGLAILRKSFGELNGRGQSLGKEHNTVWKACIWRKNKDLQFLRIITASILQSSCPSPSSSCQYLGARKESWFCIYC